LITSKYRAYPPDGGPHKLVELTHEAKRRYEQRGWRFERANSSDREAWARP
jgi:hypothetical protein